MWAPLLFVLDNRVLTSFLNRHACIPGRTPTLERRSNNGSTRKETDNCCSQTKTTLGTSSRSTISMFTYKRRWEVTETGKASTMGPSSEFLITTRLWTIIHKLHNSKYRRPTTTELTTSWTLQECSSVGETTTINNVDHAIQNIGTQCIQLALHTGEGGGVFCCANILLRNLNVLTSRELLLLCYAFPLKHSEF